MASPARVVPLTQQLITEKGKIKKPTWGQTNPELYTLSPTQAAWEILYKLQEDLGYNPKDYGLTLEYLLNAWRIMQRADITGKKLDEVLGTWAKSKGLPSTYRSYGALNKNLRSAPGGSVIEKYAITPDSIYWQMPTRMKRYFPEFIRQLEGEYAGKMLKGQPVTYQSHVPSAAVPSKAEEIHLAALQAEREQLLEQAKDEYDQLATCLQEALKTNPAVQPVVMGCLKRFNDGQTKLRQSELQLVMGTMDVSQRALARRLTETLLEKFILDYMQPISQDQAEQMAASYAHTYQEDLISAVFQLLTQIEPTFKK